MKLIRYGEPGKEKPGLLLERRRRILIPVIFGD